LLKGKKQGMAIEDNLSTHLGLRGNFMKRKQETGIEKSYNKLSVSLWGILEE
jgi:hypothetical protein